MNRILALTAPAMICAALILPAKGQTPADNDRAKSILADALMSKNPDTRKEGVKALSLVAGQEPFATRMEAMLRDKDVQVRIAVVEALAALKSERAVMALKTALGDRVAEVRFAAATALFKLNDPAGREALIAVLDGGMKTSSGFVSEHIRDGKRLLETPKPLLLLALKQGIGFAPVPYLDLGVSSLVVVKSDSGPSARASTALLLGKDTDAEVVAALHRALKDKNSAVRAAAVQALALLADPMLKDDSAALFIPLFKDKNQAVRLRAAAGYLHLDGKSSSGSIEVAAN